MLCLALLLFVLTYTSHADYDQYYASLAASSAAASAQATPSGLGMPGSSDFGDVGYEEEERKPSVEYLASLNEYRKRSRSMEDVGGLPAKAKVAKVDEGLNGYGVDEGAIALPDAQPLLVVEDDPLVYGVSLAPLLFVAVSSYTACDTVNGKPVPYSQVAEEDHDLMTPDEYTAYFEVMQARS